MIPSLYVHIPFCKRKCLYCDFFSVIYNERSTSSYIETIYRQIGLLNNQFSTIYIGGGTPTILENSLLEKLLKGLKALIHNSAEFTIEANPDSLNEKKIRLLLDNGVNRLSVGVQSFNDLKLKRLGRIHNSKRAKEAIVMAGKKGFKNISIDLIYGVWDEDMKGWEKDLKEAVDLPITHLSCYGLTYEKETPLYEAMKNGSIKPLSDETVAEMYEKAIDYLSVRGFKQYEVSNFAREGYACRHNLNYWDNNPYIGIGASAVSYIDGARKENIPDVEEYIRRSDREERPIVSSERLSPVRRAKETAALKIRTKEGIDFKWFKDRTGFDFLTLEKNALKELIDKKLIKYKKDDISSYGICLKRRGFLFCDTVSSALL